MLKLHGAPLSNYYNMVKCALIEKKVDFEEVLSPPSQEEGYLQKSAMGKIPCIETDQGFLAETDVILEYLEETYPEVPLLPGSTWQRAKVRELTRSLELYIELVARTGYAALRGKEVSDEIKNTMQAGLSKGNTAIRRLTSFSPYIFDDQFYYADLVGYFTFTLATLSARSNLEMDLFADLPGAADWFELIGSRESVRKALSDQAAMRR